MGIHLLKTGRLSKVVLFGVLLTGLLGFSVLPYVPAPRAHADVDPVSPINSNGTPNGTGSLIVHLNLNPTSAATVTITRAGVALDAGGNEVKGTPETFKLSPATGPHVTTHQDYLSSTLAYSGVGPSPTGCGSGGNPEDDAWYNWNVVVTGSATGSGTVRVNCGKTVTLNVDVVLAGSTTGKGTIAGTATTAANGDTVACASNYTQYFLVPTGTNIDFTKSGTALTLDANGKFTISADPGTYDLGVDCEYSLNGENSLNYALLGAKGVVVTSGKTTTVTLVDASKAFGSTTPGDDTLDCGSGDFNWAVCPLIDMGVKGAQTLDNFIMSTLSVDVGPIFDHTTQKGSPSNGYYVAWNSFRIIASAILVIAGLIMVSSQALGFEVLDAYTIRKTLPRLLIAIIGISLSWPLMRFTVSLFDTIGVDLRELMYAPFKNFQGSFSVGGGILSSVVGLGAILALGWTSLTFIITIGMAVFVGFATLVIREVAIVMLIIVAPVAIACSVLPNTQKAWSLWRENFLGLMLMFPIISGLIAAGHIFAAVAITTGTAGSGSVTTHANGLVSHITGHSFLLNFFTVADDIGGLTAQALALIAYFLPYFLLPMAARLATGVIGNLAGMVNDRSRGVFDRMKKARGAAMADRFKKAQNQQLWDNNSKIGKFGNKVATWATDPLNNAAYYGRNTIPGLKKRGRKVEGLIEHARLEQSKKLLEELNPVFNDKAYRAINGGLHGEVGKKGGLSEETKRRLQAKGLLGKTPQSLSDLNEVAAIMGQSDDQTERLAGNAIHGMAGRMATLYQDPEMGKASIASAGLMGLAAHGFLTRNDMAPALNRLKDEGGAAFAQTIGTQAQLLVSRSRPDLKAGYSMDYDEHTGQFRDGLTVNGGLRGYEMFATLGPGDIAGAKGGFFKTAAEGGAGDIMKEILVRGNNAKMQADAAARLKQYREVEGLSKEKIVEKYGAEDLITEQAGLHFDSVRKSLMQNAGPYAHGSVDAQTLSAEILRKAQIPFEAGAAAGQQQQEPPLPPSSQGGISW